MVIAIVHPGEEGLFILEGEDFANTTVLARYMKRARREKFEEATHYFTGAPALVNLDRVLAFRDPTDREAS